MLYLPKKRQQQQPLTVINIKGYFNVHQNFIQTKNVNFYIYSIEIDVASLVKCLYLPSLRKYSGVKYYKHLHIQRFYLLSVLGNG